MNLSDINLIKRLEAMEVQEYSKSIAPEDQKSRENSMKFSPFEGDDDDLADLLYDDDSEFKKKTSSPSKAEPHSSPQFQVYSKPSNLEGRRTKIVRDNGLFGPDKNYGENQKPIIKPTKNQIEMFLEEEEADYIGDLGLNHLEQMSPTSGFSADKSLTPGHQSKIIKEVEFDDTDNDILDDLDNSKPPIPPTRLSSGLFSIEMGKEPQTKPSLRKIMSIFDDDEPKIANEETEDDTVVYGGYVPSASPKRSQRRPPVGFKEEPALPSSPSPLKEQRKNYELFSPKHSTRPLTAAFELSNQFSNVQMPPQSPARKRGENLVGISAKEPEMASMHRDVNLPPKLETAAQRKNSAEWLGIGPVKSEELAGASFKRTTPRPRDFDFSSVHKPIPRRVTREHESDSSSFFVEMGEQKEVVSSSSDTKVPYNNFGVKQVPSAMTFFSEAPSSPSKQFSSLEPQSNSNTSHELSSLQELVQSLKKERDQMLKQKEEELKALEEEFKKKEKENEEKSEEKLQKMGEFCEEELKKLQEQIDHLNEEKKKLASEHQEKLAKMDEDHSSEIQRLKKIQNDTIFTMKQNHEDTLARFNQIKVQEIEAINDSVHHSKSLQKLSDQLEQRASELAALHQKVEDKHNASMIQKESALNAREKELKTLESRLQWQMEEGDQERKRLQNLVLHLEKTVQEQTKAGEQDRWEVMQMKAKLEMQQKFLDQETKSLSDNNEREKEKIHAAQNTLLQEQREILAQLAREQQQIRSEKVQFEALAKRIREEEARFEAKKLKEGNALENLQRFLDDESEKIQLDKELMQQDLLNLRRERDVVERERRQFRSDRDSINETKLELQRKSEELDELARRCENEKEEARFAKATARKIEAEQEHRLNVLNSKLKMLNEKQHQVAKESERLVEQKKEFEQERDSSLCMNCKLAIGLPMTALPPAMLQPAAIQPVITNISPVPSRSSLDPSLMVWCITAQRDREYLQEEIAFLQALRKEPK